MADGSIVVPGARDVRETLNGPDDASSVVVASPPHPQFGGSRSDQRLVAVADALADRGIACLRFDYGPWDGGPGELTDAVTGIRWADERFDSIGVFGYSFGGAVALCAAADSLETDWEICAVSVLAPVASIDGQLDAVSALSALADRGVSLQVLYGTRDRSADWQPVVEHARDRGCALAAFEADHFFLAKHDDIAAHAVDFLSSGT